MLKVMVRDLKLQRDTFLWMLAIMAAAFAVGVGMVLLMVLRGGEDTWFCMGTIYAMIVVVIFALLAGISGFGTEFRMCLSMGGTRKAFLVSYALRQALLLAAGYAIVRLLYAAECALYGGIFSGMENDAPFTFLKSVWCLPVLAGLRLLFLFLGSLTAKFGKKGMIVFWFLWLFCCLLLPRMFDSDDTSALGAAANVVLAVILTVPPMVWAAFLGVTAAAMIAAIVYWGMRQAV